MTLVKGKMLYLFRHNTLNLGASGGERNHIYTTGEKGIQVHPDELNQ
jgi:hypothetical protein